MISTLITTGRRRRFTGAWGLVVTVASAVLSAGVIYANIFTISDPLILGILFVSALFTLLFLKIGAAPDSPERPTPIDFALSASCIVTGLYFYAHVDETADRITLLHELSNVQLAFGSILLFVSLEATRRTTGMGLTAIVLLFMIYNLFGHLLPPPFAHGLIDYPYLLDILIFTTDGVFGVPIQVVASYVFLFVMFGTFLSTAGGGNFFFDLAAGLTGKQAGGPAKVAVISSGLYGMISGSPTSDVVTTGSVTIPVMRRLGYERRFAGAVEVSASTGGSALPPIMGSAAFILAEYTGIEYREVAIAAIVPALLYYAGVFSQVHFRAVRQNLKSYDSEAVPAVRTTLLRGWVYVVPVVAIIAALLAGYSPVFVAAYGLLALVAATALRRESRLSPWSVVEALAETTTRILPVAGACAAAGLVIGGLTMTGLAGKAANLVLLLSGNIPLITLIIAALVTIILGLGMPTPSAYILAAVLIGPAFAHIGVPLLESNLFHLYYALLSALTPPIAVAAMAAAAIAEENPFKIAFDAMKLAAVGFLMPFVFIWNPAFVGHDDPVHVLLALAGGSAAAVCAGTAIEGFFCRPVAPKTRIGLILLAAAAVSPYPAAAVAATVICLTLAVLAVRRQRRDAGNSHAAHGQDDGD